MDPILTAALTALGLVAGATGAYLAVRRQRSGRIDTSEAAQLWMEAGNIRQELKSEVITLRGQIDAGLAREASLRAQVDVLQRSSAEQEREIYRLREKVSELQREIEGKS